MVLSVEPQQTSIANEKEYTSTVIADVEITSKEELAELREFVSPMESRRMGKLMKAAHLASLRALKEAGMESPDAIVTATARGMLETSTQFLEEMLANGEELLKPTLFMQSTQNTLSSAIAIRTKCHGYNITYSQGEESMKWAMRDAERLIATGKAKSVLVGLFPWFSLLLLCQPAPMASWDILYNQLTEEEKTWVVYSCFCTVQDTSFEDIPEGHSIP